MSASAFGRIPKQQQQQRLRDILIKRAYTYDLVTAAKKQNVNDFS